MVGRGQTLLCYIQKMLSCILILPKVPPDPLPPPILYEYKIANFPETLDHIPKMVEILIGNFCKGLVVWDGNWVWTSYEGGGLLLGRGCLVKCIDNL